LRSSTVIVRRAEFESISTAGSCFIHPTTNSSDNHHFRPSTPQLAQKCGPSHTTHVPLPSSEGCGPGGTADGGTEPGPSRKRCAVQWPNPTPRRRYNDYVENTSEGDITTTRRTPEKVARQRHEKQSAGVEKTRRMCRRRGSKGGIHQVRHEPPFPAPH